MNYKCFCIVLTIVLMITSIVCCKKSTMHKPFFITENVESNVEPTNNLTFVKNEKKAKNNIKQNQATKTFSKELIYKKENQNDVKGKSTQKENPNLSATELIWWNQWKSNLHNKFQRDLSIKAMGNIPNDYEFVINFTVTKNGKVKNITTDGFPENYRQKWEFYSKQILKSYEGTSILNFPPRTQLEAKPITLVFISEGDSSAKNPEDFEDDYEVIHVKK